MTSLRTWRMEQPDFKLNCRGWARCQPAGMCSRYRMFKTKATTFEAYATTFCPRGREQSWLILACRLFTVAFLSTHRKYMRNVFLR